MILRLSEQLADLGFGLVASLVIVMTFWSIGWGVIAVARERIALDRLQAPMKPHLPACLCALIATADVLSTLPHLALGLAHIHLDVPLGMLVFLALPLFCVLLCYSLPWIHLTLILGRRTLGYEDILKAKDAQMESELEPGRENDSPEEIAHRQHGHH